MVEQKMYCPVMVRAVGPNGTAMCNLRAVDPMTAYELHVCTITALAKFLPAPMISIRLIWIQQQLKGVGDVASDDEGPDSP